MPQPPEWGSLGAFCTILMSGPFSCLKKLPVKHEAMPGSSAMRTQQFVDKAQKVHKARYDYSQTEYENSMEKVSIICPEHGDILQRAKGHLAGQGCPKCGFRTSTLDQYLVKARAMHGNRYDYSATEYTGAHEKTTFICKVHGVFEQLAHAHLAGRGCPQCAHTASCLSIVEWLRRCIRL